ncbi:MAG TPA: NAD(P)H-binding protein, partial [Longimicrobium sp.]|nr:NAD(P)H-binding protein [Longimicrobium sp.]
MKVLVFGATGAAGGSVLRACLDSPHVSEVRAVVRRPLAVAHPKLRVVIHRDFLDYGAAAEAFAGVDACLWCLGISVRQTSGEDEYRTITHDYALA